MSHVPRIHKTSSTQNIQRTSKHQYKREKNLIQLGQSKLELSTTPFGSFILTTFQKMRMLINESNSSLFGSKFSSIY